MNERANEEDWHVTLLWRGPIHAGSLWKSLTCRTVPGHHVYFYLTRFPAVDRVAAYVGRCDNLETRIRDHMSMTLSLQYWVRDERAEWQQDPQNWCSNYDRVDELLPLAVAAVKRYEFYAAACDPRMLRAVEGRLIRLVYEKAQIDQNVLSDNSKNERDDERLVLTHRAESPEVREVVARLFENSVAG